MTILKNNRSRALLLATICSSVFIALFTFATSAQAVYNGVPVYNMNVGKVTIGFGGSFCTGTLISPHLVLTASHCIYSTPPSHLGFFLGGHEFHPYPISDPLVVDWTPLYHYRVVDYRELGGPVPKNIEKGFNLGMATRDVAVLILATPVPSNVATPVPFGTVFPYSSTLTLIGYGPSCEYCNDDDRQRGAAYLFTGAGTHNACPGDSGGPVLDLLGNIVGTNSVGTCGSRSSNSFQDYYGDTIYYRSAIEALITQFDGGPPTCTASISPTYGNEYSQYNAIFVASGGTSCGYYLDNRGFEPISCALTSLNFSGVNLGVAQHSLIFKVQNARGTRWCPNPALSFEVIPRPGSENARVTISGPTNMNPGDTGTYNGNVFGYYVGKVFRWTVMKVAPK